MKQYPSRKISTTIFTFFPIFLLTLFYPFETSRFQVKSNENIVEIQSDSMITDTIITFDPATKEESISFITRDSSTPSIFEKNAKTYQQIKKMGEPGRVDTVFIFDPETKKESMYIIKN